MIELVIPGEPVGKQRPKVFPMRTRTGLIIRRGVTPERTVNYEVLIRELFAVRYPGFQPLEGPLMLTIEAFLGIPKSASKKKRAAMESGSVLPEKRPDFDNLAKTAADALEGVAFRNDSQIAEAVIRKRYSTAPRMRITIRPVADCPAVSDALLAERKLGGMLKETEDQRPAGSRGIGKSGVPREYPTLSDLGLTKRESSEAQVLADLPDDDFQEVREGRKSKKAAVNEARRGLTQADIARSQSLYLRAAAESLRKGEQA